MKTMKIFGGVGILLIALIAGLMFYLLTNLDAIIKRVIETEGPEVTRTSVSLRDVAVKPFAGTGELNHFVIGNPDGFDSEYLLRWDTIRLDIDPLTVNSEVIVIEEITISGVNIIAEQKGLKTNLQKLLDNLQQSLSSSAESEPEGQAKDVRLAVKHLSFQQNSIDFVTEKYGSYTLEIPSFELNNLGSKTNGLTPQELGYAIVQPLVQKAKRQVEERAKQLAKEELEAKVNEKKDELKAKADAELEDKEAEAKSKLDSKLKGLLNKE